MRINARAETEKMYACGGSCDFEETEGNEAEKGNDRKPQINKVVAQEFKFFVILKKNYSIMQMHVIRLPEGVNNQFEITVLHPNALF